MKCAISTNIYLSKYIDFKSPTINDLKQDKI